MAARQYQNQHHNHHISCSQGSNEFKRYISDYYYTLTGDKNLFCDKMMGAGCKNQVNNRTFDRWRKAMDYNNLKCPYGDIDDSCDSGCFKYYSFAPDYPGKCITVEYLQ